MSLHKLCPLNASRRRARKRTLAARDGAWCAYCGRLFADLRCATIDHVVPLSLFATWRVEHTVLACQTCNGRKANRLPLLLALLASAQVESQMPDGRPAPVRRAHVPSRGALTVADCLLLARTAAAVEAGHRADGPTDRPHDQSRGEQDERPGARMLRALPTGTAVRTRPHTTAPDASMRRHALTEAA